MPDVVITVTLHTSADGTLERTSIQASLPIHLVEAGLYEALKVAIVEKQKQAEGTPRRIVGVNGVLPSAAGLLFRPGQHPG